MNSILFVLMMTCLVMLTNSFRVCEKNGTTCEKTTLGQNIFSYSDNLSWDEMSSDQLWGWLKGQLRKDLTTFCKETTRHIEDESLNEPSVSVVAKVANCDRQTTTFRGRVDKEGLPKGHGIIFALPDREIQTIANSKKYFFFNLFCRFTVSI